MPIFQVEPTGTKRDFRSERRVIRKDKLLLPIIGRVPILIFHLHKCLLINRPKTSTNKNTYEDLQLKGLKARNVIARPEGPGVTKQIMIRSVGPAQIGKPADRKTFQKTMENLEERSGTNCNAPRKLVSLHHEWWPPRSGIRYM